MTDEEDREFDREEKRLLGTGGGSVAGSNVADVPG